MTKSFFLSQVAIHKSWIPFLSNKIINLLKDIEKKINIESSTPSPQLVLRFLEMDLHQIPVVILGQDPYPQKGIATGRAFEVNGLHSWHDKFRNVSLKNILRCLYKVETCEERKYSEILPHINEGDRLCMKGDFSILPPNRLFSYWAEHENVLLLNTAFTCEIGKPNSHAKLWAPFTQELLAYIAETNLETIWFLWGNNAQKIMTNIITKNKIETTHPMMCYQRENDILFGEVNPFEKTNEIINWTGK
ncbi:uracil-DNA glycosylase [Labilibaculum sp.]|uniref:uracil-DNA glycosylase n=1 Tax=Labilibaculum sp. TaxID=2060723 RepID=UPI0035667DDA